MNHESLDPGSVAKTIFDLYLRAIHSRQQIYDDPAMQPLFDLLEREYPGIPRSSETARNLCTFAIGFGTACAWITAQETEATA